MSLISESFIAVFSRVTALSAIAAVAIGCSMARTPSSDAHAGDGYATPAVLDDAARERIRQLPAHADVEFDFDRSDSALGSAILTVGENAVRLVLVGAATGADVYSDFEISEAEATSLVGGGAINCTRSAAAGYLRAVTERVSLGYAIEQCSLDVDRNGHFALDMQLVHEGERDYLQARGRLTGACEQVDENSTVRRVVDLSVDDRCEHLLGWL